MNRSGSYNPSSGEASDVDLHLFYLDPDPVFSSLRIRF